MTRPLPHAYPGKHRGEPRTCAGCSKRETECADWHLFADEVGTPIYLGKLPGRHRADGPPLEGP